MKRLIINADDFGFTHDVNAGIVHAHLHGVLTSTTIMANGNAFEDAVSLAKANPTLDVGCHLVLVQGKSVLTSQPLPPGLGELLMALATGRIDIYAELRAQVEKIVSAGIRPSHLDSHKHTHLLPAIFKAVTRLAEEFKVPFVRLPIDATAGLPEWAYRGVERLYRRGAVRRGIQMTDHFRGFRLTGCLDEASLAAALRSLPDGSTELMCHPGFLGADLRVAPTRLKESRLRELEALTSPRIRELLAAEGVRLSPFCRELS